jgi:hypothetical protein
MSTYNETDTNNSEKNENDDQKESPVHDLPLSTLAELMNTMSRIKDNIQTLDDDELDDDELDDDELDDDELDDDELDDEFLRNKKLELFEKLLNAHMEITKSFLLIIN